MKPDNYNMIRTWIFELYIYMEETIGLVDRQLDANGRKKIGK